MKSISFSIAFFVFSLSSAHAQSLYNPAADARADLDAAVSRAAREKKQVLVQVGGNWCKWCIEFHRFCQADTRIDSLLRADYVFYPLNYSKENKNESLLARYGYPQRFGFPVFLILNAKGERLHTQNSEYLEDGGSSYDSKKVFTFLMQWRPAALDPSLYP